MNKKTLPSFPWDILIEWYTTNGRHHLPWRDYSGSEEQRGYRVWLSEILLQQTQVDRVIPYFQKIREKYPTIHHLAQSSYDEFFPYYQGMGYYSRARNILKTANIISKEYNGIFPTEKKLLQKLPGVGGYTSSAILGFAYGEAYLAWDTNLEKVFARYYNGTKSIKLTDEEKEYIENDFREFIKNRKEADEKKIKAQNGESEWDKVNSHEMRREGTLGYKLFELDESKRQMSEANEFLSPSGAFGTFQSGKVHDQKTGFLHTQEGQEQAEHGNKFSTGSHSQGQKQYIVRAINNGLMDFASLIDLKNPDTINWDAYIFRESIFYKNRGSLEPKEEKKSISFPIPDATIIVILHEDHRAYYGPHLTPQSPLLQRGEAVQKAPSPLGEGRGEIYSPFILPPSLSRDTRSYIQEYFKKHHNLELSVRPVHKKWLSKDGKPYIAVNAQIQVGNKEQFGTFEKKEAQIVLKEIIGA